MGISDRLLGDGEVVVVRLREHAKKLFWPVVVLILSAVAAGAGIAFMHRDWEPWGTYSVIGLFVLVFIIWVFLPWLRWLTTTITITNRRIITRKGIITRTGHDLPLRRINNVTYERDFIDRLVGCGTLIMETAANEPLTLTDIPRVESVHVQITELLFASDYDDE